MCDIAQKNLRKKVYKAICYALLVLFLGIFIAIYINIFMIIKTKIITIIALSVIITVGISTTFVLKIQNERLREAKIEDTLFLADIIERTIDNAMKEGKTEDVQKIIENIGKNQEVVHLRILSPDGKILKSAKISEIGIKSPDYLTLPTNKPQQMPSISNTSITYFKNIANRQLAYPGPWQADHTDQGGMSAKKRFSRTI